MVIPYSELFELEVSFQREEDDVWLGVGKYRGPSEALVGDRSLVKLSSDELTLQSIDRVAGRTFSDCAYVAGEALKAVLQAGDRMLVCRGPGGDVGAAITRGGDLVLTLGAAESVLTEVGVGLEVDPRAFEVSLYYPAHVLAAPSARLVWFDPKSPDLEQRMEELQRIPTAAGNVIAAVRSDNREEIRVLNKRIFELARDSQCGLAFYSVSERYETAEEWRTYLGTLPTRRPRDLFVRIKIDGRSIEVREQEYVFDEPWHLFVDRVFTPGVPGKDTRVGIGRAESPLTRAMLQTSAEAFGQPVIPRSASRAQ